MTQTQTTIIPVKLPIVCEDFDKTCRLFTIDEARDCYEGGVHQCKNGVVVYLPKANGICPILSEASN